MSFGDFARIACETQMIAAMLTLKVMSGIDVSGGGFAGLIRLGPRDPDPDVSTGGELDFAARYSMFGGGGRPDFAKNGSSKLTMGQKVLNFLAKAMESPLGIVVAAVVGVAVIAGAVLAGVGLASALIIGATAAFFTQAAVGALDVATGGGMGRAVGQWAGPWMSAFKGVLGAVYIAGTVAELIVVAGGIAAMGGIGSVARNWRRNIGNLGEYTPHTPKKGDIIYRVHGGDAKPWGHSYSPVNPRYIPGYRNVAGLPRSNTANRLTIAKVIDPDDIIVRPAEALHGNMGGITEYVVKNPARSLEFIREVNYFERWYMNHAFYWIWGKHRTWRVYS